MSVDPDLVRLLKRLKLGLLVPTLPERLTLARAQQLDYAAFLTLLLADEVQRRDQQALERRLLRAGFEERVGLESFDWHAAVQLDRRALQALFSLQFLTARQHVLFVGPVGVGKTFFAQALGTAAARVGHSVLFSRADRLLKELGQARADDRRAGLLLDKGLQAFPVLELLRSAAKTGHIPDAPALQARK